MTTIECDVDVDEKADHDYELYRELTLKAVTLIWLEPGC